MYLSLLISWNMSADPGSRRVGPCLHAFSVQITRLCFPGLLMYMLPVPPSVTFLEVP